MDVDHSCDALTMPGNTITLPVMRVSGGTVHTRTIGTATDGVTFDSATTGNVWYAPFRLPSDYDITRKSTLYIDFQCAVTNAQNGFTALFNFLTTHTNTSGVALNSSGILSLAIPNPWTALDMLRIPLLAGLDFTYPANRYLAGDVVGLFIKRLPTDPEDNYPQSIGAIASLTLEYYRRCQWGGCL
jgi:hypothetical protein